MNLNSINLTIKDNSELLPGAKFSANINDYGNYEVMKEHWLNLFGTLELDPSETVRITHQLKPLTHRAQELMDLPNNDSNKVKSGTTKYEHIYTFEQLFTHWQKAVIDHISNGFIPGLSMASGIFNFEKNVAPGKSSLKRSKMFMVDVDISRATGAQGRYPFNNLPETTRNALIYITLSKLGDALFNSGIRIPNIKKAAATGGGFQLMFEFDKEANPKQLEAIYNGFMNSFVKRDTVQNGQKIKQNVKSIAYAKGPLNEDLQLIIEFDTSSKDITHTQRVIGTLNNKYMNQTFYINDSELFDTNYVSNCYNDYMNETLINMDLFEDLSKQTPLKIATEQLVDIHACITNGSISIFDNFFDSAVTTINEWILSSSPEISKVDAYELVESIDMNGQKVEKKVINKNVLIEKIKHANNVLVNEYEYPSQPKKDPNNPNKNSKLIYERTNYDTHYMYITGSMSNIFSIFKNSSKLVNVDEFETKYEIDKLSYTTNKDFEKNSKSERHMIGKIPFLDLKTTLEEMVDVQYSSSDALYLANPFKEGDDKNYSMAMYYNNGYPKFIDFLKGNECYDLVTFWAQVRGIDRSLAVSEIVTHFDIQLVNKDYNTLTKIEAQSTVANLIEKIDKENFIYYRNAQKSRSCIVRTVATGEHRFFDGPQMLADHILTGQLGVKNPDKETKFVFREAFEERILIDAFEEFIPGAPMTTKSEFFKIVNLWVPGKNYKVCHEVANSFEEKDLSLDRTIELIKERTPFMYYYLMQITQKGSLSYFVNWLACVGQFKIMPTLPVMTSVQGSGKNLFIDEVMSFYLNSEYVNVVNSDKIMSNFNSFLETSSLVVLDEGDFSRTKDVDQLKLLTGNNTLQIERKGIDSIKKKRTFNFIMLTNGENPIKHPISDRRITYFRLDVDLTEMCAFINRKTGQLSGGIEEFITEIRDEMVQFWSILLNTNIKSEWCNGNLKNGQFNKQILGMHPFGQMLIKMLDNDWNSIKLQLNEKVEEDVEVTKNVNMVEEIYKQFHNNTNGIAEISLPMINKYLKSKEYKSFTSIQEFIEMNNLQKFGISIKVTENGQNKKVLIRIDKNKVLETTYCQNNLEEIIPERFGNKAPEIILGLDKSNLDNLDKKLNQSDTIENKMEMGKSTFEGYEEACPVNDENLMKPTVQRINSQQNEPFAPQNQNELIPGMQPTQQNVPGIPGIPSSINVPMKNNGSAKLPNGIIN